MQVNPAKGNGAGKKKKQYCKYPPQQRIYLMIPEDKDE
jgi:hypothetical protein